MMVSTLHSWYNYSAITTCIGAKRNAAKTIFGGVLPNAWRTAFHCTFPTALSASKRLILKIGRPSTRQVLGIQVTSSVRLKNVATQNFGGIRKAACQRAPRLWCSRWHLIWRVWLTWLLVRMLILLQMHWRWQWMSVSEVGLLMWRECDSSQKNTHSSWCLFLTRTMSSSALNQPQVHRVCDNDKGSGYWKSKYVLCSWLRFSLSQSNIAPHFHTFPECGGCLEGTSFSGSFVGIRPEGYFDLDLTKVSTITGKWLHSIVFGWKQSVLCTSPCYYICDISGCYLLLRR